MMIGSNGPNISSVMISASSGGSISIVGSMNLQALHNCSVHDLLLEAEDGGTAGNKGKNATTRMDVWEVTISQNLGSRHAQLKPQQMDLLEDCSVFQNFAC